MNHATLNLAQTVTLLAALLQAPNPNGGLGLPVLITGPPGVGKTAVIGQLFRALRLRLLVIIASLREPTDFGGIPVVTTDGIERRVDAALAHYQCREGGILLDEINTAPPAVQKALFRLVQERVIGDVELDPRVRIIAAMNPEGTSTGTWDLDAPLANRFGHVIWPDPEAATWSRVMIGGPPRIEVPRLDPVNWEPALARARGAATGFVSCRPELLFQQPKEGDPAVSAAWPSPRTWELAIHALAAADCCGVDTDIRDAMVAAYVGHGAAVEFVAWLHAADLPDPGTLLDGGVDWSHDALRIDRTVAVLSGCVAHVIGQDATTREAQLVRLWGLLGDVMGPAPDLCVAPADVLVDAGLSHGSNMIRDAAKQSLAKLYLDLMAAVPAEQA